LNIDSSVILNFLLIIYKLLRFPEQI